MRATLRTRCAILRKIGDILMVSKEKKSYTMQEMADILNVNKTTVYRYLKKEHIAPATVESNTNLYNAITLQHLKKHFEKPKAKEKVSKSANELLIETLQQQVHQLQMELDAEKTLANNQLQEKDNQIENLHKLLDQSQQLILNAQEENKKLLPKNDKDNHRVEAGEYKEKSPSNKEDEHASLNKEKANKESWFKRFFS